MKTALRLWVVFMVAAACGVAHANSVTSLVNAAGGSWHNPSTWVGNVVPTTGDDVVVVATNGVTLTNSTDFLNSLLIRSNATLTFSGWTTLLTASNVDVLAYGTITHTACTTNTAPTNRVYMICSNLTVAGAINASGRGYAGGDELGSGQRAGPGQGWRSHRAGKRRRCR
jgi:hypothetical protein